MKNNNPLLSKNLFRLILLFCIGIIPISLWAQTTEHFTNGEIIGGTTFSEGGFSFNMTGGRFATFEGLTYGWTGTVKDNRYVDNYGNYPATAGVLGSFVIASGTFKVSDLYVFPGETGDWLANTGSIIIRGKLSGATQFTYTIASGSINMSGIVNNGFTYANLSAYSSLTLDQLEFEVTGALRYLAIDAFKFTGTSSNSAPTDVALSASTINENVVANSTVGTLSSTDPDAGNSFTYSLVAGTGSTDNASFTISGSNLLINSSPNFESKSSYSIRVRTTDQGSLYYEKAMTITINDLNEAPTDLALSASAINENVAGNSTVGSLSSTDADAANSFTYLLVVGTGSTDNASFTISGSNLLINSSPNFESKSSYSIRLRTTDQGSLYYEKAMTITINDLNEAPTDLTLSASAINENVVGNSTVGSLSSTDVDAVNTFTYTLVAGTGSTDNASFNISGSSLRITSSPDFETKNSYSVRIRTTDQGTLFFEKTFTISINNVNETPSDIALSISAINENVIANSAVGTLSSTDVDAANIFTYTLVAGTGSTDNASFNISGSSLRITNSPDFETKNSYSVRVRTTDQGTLFFEKTFTVSINNVNEAPSDIALSASAINENVIANSIIGTLSSTDVDAANTFSYTLVAGTGSTDNASFNISGSNLRITSSPNYEVKSSYSVRVRTTDQSNILYFEKAFTVTINDLNEAAVTSTQAVSSIGATTATGNGNITDLGSPNPTAYGVCWNTSSTPTTSNGKVDKGAVSATGAFIAAITGLTPNTTYYVRAFATNSSGTVYGGEVNFTTLPAAASTYSGIGSWPTPSNWSNGIPGSSTTVTIDGDVTLNTSTTVKTITINSGSSLTVAVNQTLTVPNGIYNNGFITNNGTIDGAVVVPIVFEENGGTFVSDLLQDYGTALTLPTPTKNGYNFMGWYSDIALNTVFNETTMPLNGVTLYAKWQLATGLTVVESDALTLYPNPAVNSITVVAGNKQIHVVIYSLAGEFLLSEDVTGSALIDISSLPKGTYLVKLNGETTKLIKM